MCSRWRWWQSTKMNTKYNTCYVKTRTMLCAIPRPASNKHTHTLRGVWPDLPKQTFCLFLLPREEEESSGVLRNKLKYFRDGRISKLPKQSWTVSYWKRCQRQAPSLGGGLYSSVLNTVNSQELSREKIPTNHAISFNGKFLSCVFSAIYVWDIRS